MEIKQFIFQSYWFCGLQVSFYIFGVLALYGKTLEGWIAFGIRCTRFWNYVELFWNSLDNAPSSIVFYLEINVEVEVGVHDIRSQFTPRKPPTWRTKYLSSSDTLSSSDWVAVRGGCWANHVERMSANRLPKIVNNNKE